MEMSPQYLAETVNALKAWGFNTQKEARQYGAEADDSPRGEAYLISRGRTEQFSLEWLADSEGTTRYYFEISRYHNLRSFSHELNSWKIFDDRVEFRYHSQDDTGRALSLILSRDQP